MAASSAGAAGVDPEPPAAVIVSLSSGDPSSPAAGCGGSGGTADVSVPAGEPLPSVAADPLAEGDEKAETKGEKCVAIDVKCGSGGEGGDFDHESESVCRICHLSPDRSAASGSEGVLIQIGCGCRGELGIAHRHCAEAWFRVKGNRYCEICGSNAKNIYSDDINLMEWHERRTMGNTRHRNSAERVGCSRGQRFCNFFMACLVVAFILPWFFRVNLF